MRLNLDNTKDSFILPPLLIAKRYLVKLSQIKFFRVVLKYRNSKCFGFRYAMFHSAVNILM